MSEHWDARFMEIAELVATWSKDRSVGVGCVLVGGDKTITSVGYNGFPRGVDDDLEERHARPDKYMWTEHAERNAIYNAARNGARTFGSTAYLTWFPCMDCARALVQAGVARLVAHKPDLEDKEWGPHFQHAITLFSEAGVELTWFDKNWDSKRGRGVASDQRTLLFGPLQDDNP